MNGMDRERFEDLKDAYVLGALPEEEREEFERYLLAHPDLQKEMEELSTVAGLLALSVPEQEPPPELRRKIMATVEAEAVPPAEGAPSRARRRSWLAGLWEAVGIRDLALAAAAVLVVGLFSWGVLLQGEVRDLQGRVQSLQSQPKDQPQGPQMIALGGEGTEQGARAELVTLEGDRAVLVAENMPPAPEGKTYQIWVIKDDTPKPSGLFDPRGDSVAAVVENPVEGADAVAVTIEPEGGSKEPTTDPMLEGKVEA
jgi:anti-sigma-K factor RskA